MCWLGAALEQEDNYELQTPEKCRIARLMVAKPAGNRSKDAKAFFAMAYFYDISFVN